MRKCSVLGCEGKHKARGYCGKHYARYLKHGSAFIVLDNNKKKNKRCIIDSCFNKHVAGGYCGKHYQRFKKHNDITTNLRVKNRVCEIEGCNRKHDARGLCNIHYQTIYMKDKKKEYRKSEKFKKWSREYQRKKRRDPKYKDIYNNYAKKYRDNSIYFKSAERKQKINKKTRERNLEIRNFMINAYGGTCILCGESNLLFLEFDHVNDDGYIERREGKSTQQELSQVYQHYKKSGVLPSKLQLLCCNCNHAKDFVNIPKLETDKPIYQDGIRLCQVKDCYKKYSASGFCRQHYDQYKKTYYRIKLVEILGINCICCGESETKYLTIDHISNDGFLKRNIRTKEYREAVRKFEQADLIPNGLQVLCWNCNTAKAINGSCPYH